MPDIPLLEHLPRVLVVDPIAPAALAELRATYAVTVHLQPTPADLLHLLEAADAIVLRSGIALPAEMIEAARDLRVIARAGNGTDNIDLAAAKRAGIQVFNIPSVSSGAVAELALGLTFAVARQIALADRQVRDGVWDKPALAGPELTGKTMGIVGLGNIGSRLAQLATGVGMNVVATVAHPSRERRYKCARRGIQLADLSDVLAWSDVVTLACPLTDRTRHLIAAAQLATMKSTAYLVNVARGDVVDEDALYKALEQRVIAGAAADVHAVERATSPLAKLNNVVLTPHIGAMSTDAQDRIGELLTLGLARALSGRDAPTRIC